MPRVDPRPLRWPLVVVFLAACGSGTIKSFDGGGLEPDAGEFPDAGPWPEAGARDAGVPDAGALPDAGMPNDGGGVGDGGGGPVDAGSTPDAGATPDAGPRDAGFFYGDRNLGTTIVYPDAAFVQNGGRVINVRSPPTGIRAAAGDGTTDDTQAFLDVFDYLKADFLANAGFCKYWVYLPEGTYLVSDTLIYRGEAVGQATVDDGGGWFDLVDVRFVGQNREKTILRLKDSSAGFQDAGGPKILLSYQPHDNLFNNVAASNVLENLTIDTGAGNPGAAAVFFQGANSTEMSNVLIKSEDGAGACGLFFPQGSMQGYLHDITIQGFADGIYQTDDGEMDTAFEHLTLAGQSHAGIHLSDGNLSVRAAEIDERTTGAMGIEVDKGGAMLVAVDSELQLMPSAQAIVLTADAGQQAFVRKVAVVGTDGGVVRAGQLQVGGSVTEWVSTPPITLFAGQPAKSFALPVLDTPIVPWPDPTQWANVDDYGAVGDGGVDDTTAIQAALNSGLPLVYFPKARYRVTKTLKVPATVSRIEGLSGGLPNPAFDITAASSAPVIIRGLGGYGAVTAYAPRDVVLNLWSGPFDNRLDAGTMNLFLESAANIGGSALFTIPGQHTFARSLNDEEAAAIPDGGYDIANTPADVNVQGGVLWMFGYKTENKPVPSVYASAGALVEVLGGYVNVTQPFGPVPTISNWDSNVSYSGSTNLFCGDVDIPILEERAGVREFLDGGAALPWRETSHNGCYDIPLYVGYAPSAVP